MKKKKKRFRRISQKQYKGFYTLEASWMMTLAVMVFGAILLLGVDLYARTGSYIKANRPDLENPVKTFREIAWGKNVVSQVSHKVKEGKK